MFHCPGSDAHPQVPRLSRTGNLPQPDPGSVSPASPQAVTELEFGDRPVDDGLHDPVGVVQAVVVFWLGVGQGRHSRQGAGTTRAGGRIRHGKHPAHLPWGNG